MLRLGLFSLALLSGCATGLRARIDDGFDRTRAIPELCTSSGESVDGDARVTAIDAEPLAERPRLAELLVTPPRAGTYHLVEPADDGDAIFVTAVLGAGLGGLVTLGPLLIHGLGCLGPAGCGGLEDWEVGTSIGGLVGGVLVATIPAIVLELAEDTVIDPERDLGVAVPCEG